MAAHANQIDALPGQRISYLIAPREHGAWGFLFVPLVTGGAVGLLAGGDVVPFIAFTVAALRSKAGWARAFSAPKRSVSGGLWASRF
jgi:hypothetical protein